MPPKVDAYTKSFPPEFTWIELAVTRLVVEEPGFSVPLTVSELPAPATVKPVVNVREDPALTVTFRNVVVEAPLSDWDTPEKLTFELLLVVV